MQKLTTNQIIDAIKRNKAIILIPALILGLLIGLKEIVLPAKYEAEAVLIVTNTEDKPMTYNKLILNEKLSSVYGGFLESEDLFEGVSEKLDSEIEAKSISKNFAYELNPPAGLISLTYYDSSQQRAEDTLKLIAEEFRAYARNFLNMENIEYLQSVAAKKTSKVRGIIFTLGGLILGALIGIIILIIKEILSDRINSSDDIRETGIEVLADLSKNNTGEMAKIRRKIEEVSPKAIIGISPIKEKSESVRIKENLANILNADLLKANSLSQNEELLKNNSYILIDEPGLDREMTYNLAKLEDYKIILANKSAYKKELYDQIKELDRLNIKVLGVIYH